MNCDFCKVDLKAPFWDYPCVDFDLDVIMYHSKTLRNESRSFAFSGGWLACDDCHDEIEAHHGDDDHIVKYLTAKNAEVLKTDVTSVNTDIISAIWKAFSEHRTGQPVLCDE